MPLFYNVSIRIPFKILSKHKKEKPVILDPFCGRGTTIYAAREAGLSAWGIDSSPIAVAIAKAKLASATKEQILNLANELIANEPSHVPDTAFFKKAYHPSTLKELCALREGLLSITDETDASILLRAAALGCLHGPMNSSIDNAAYFSNQMPRTFSTKPDYSVKFWKSRKLIAPEVKVLKVLDRKISRIGGIENESVGHFTQIIHSDSCSVKTYEKLPRDIGLVITSPPYYGMRTYIQDQWLRHWFLGGPESLFYDNTDQLNHNGQDSFISDLASVWENIDLQSDSDNLHLYIRFGSIPSAKSDPKHILAASLEEAGNWKLISTRNASTAHAGNRQAEQMAKGSTAAIEFDFHAVRC